MTKNAIEKRAISGLSHKVICVTVGYIGHFKKGATMTEERYWQIVQVLWELETYLDARSQRRLLNRLRELLRT